jgi:hypothetical protein
MAEEGFKRKLTASAIELAKFSGNRSLQLIGLADTKASIVVAATGVIVALLVNSELLQSVSGPIVRGIYIATIVLLVSSAVVGLRILWPRRCENPTASKVFHEYAIQNKQKYAENLLSKPETVLEDYANNAVRLAEDVARQFFLLKISVSLLVSGLVLLLILVVLDTFCYL